MEEKSKKIENFSSKTSHKMAYLMLVEDPSVRVKYRAFVGAQVIHTPETAQIKGYEINWSDRDKINSYEDALEKANKKNSSPDSVDISYPWARVISVRNVCYKRSDL